LVTQGIVDPSVVPIYPLVESLLESCFRVVAPGIHWGEIFFAFLNGERSGLDATLDNAPWPEGMELLANWDWAPGEGYASGRYFFFARTKHMAAG
jgi:hypothetical protein